MNRCPPEYRNLTPAMECHLRGLRLGTIERPGALPKLETQAAVVAKNKARRAAIMQHLRNGIKTAGGLRQAVHGGQWVQQIILALIEDGMVRVTGRAQNGGTCYEVVE